MGIQYDLLSKVDVARSARIVPEEHAFALQIEVLVQEAVQTRAWRGISRNENCVEVSTSLRVGIRASQVTAPTTARKTTAEGLQASDRAKREAGQPCLPNATLAATQGGAPARAAIDPSGMQGTGNRGVRPR